MPRQELVAHLVALRRPLREQLGREETFGEVVVAAIAIPAGEAERADDGQRLHHRPDGGGGPPEPLDRRFAFEIERALGSVGADLGQDLLREDALLVDQAAGPAQRGSVPADPIERQLVRGKQVERLVVRLEQGPASVQQLVRELALVAGDPRLEDEIVVAARDVQRIELERAQPFHDRHDALVGRR